jgi:tRNA A37 threonylcarbamoyladenosine dehydratase
MTSSSFSKSNAATSPTVLLLAVGALAGASMTLLTTWILLRYTNTNHDGETKRRVVTNVNTNTSSHEGQQGSKSIQNGAITKNSSASSSSSSSQLFALPTALRQEQLSRHTLYFGKAGMERLQQARICVVGVGGVGSHTVHMLARAGIGCIRIIDFDQVSLSSLNRHACATLQDVGTSKVMCLINYCRQLCPDSNLLELQAYCEMYTEQSGPRLLDPCHLDDDDDHDAGMEETKRQQPQTQDKQWDLVIDAIDDVPTKACLIADCLQRGIRVLSCMGAGGKCDFTRLHVSDLRGAVKDPLATKLRQALKKRLRPNQREHPNQLDNTKDKQKNDKSSHTDADNNDDSFYLDDMERLTVVYSSEKPVCKLADFTPQQKQDGIHQYGAVDGMRIRILPVLGTMPAIMGQGLAAVALTELAATIINNDDNNNNSSSIDTKDLPHRMQPVTVERVSRNVRNRLLQRFTTREDHYGKLIIQEYGEKGNTTCTRDLTSDGGTLFKISGTHDDTTRDIGDNDDSSSTMTKTIWIGPPQIDFDDVEYLMDVWRNRCAVTGARLGTVLDLTRWDMSKPSTCDNIILVASHTLEKFQTNKGFRRTEWIDPLIRQRIQDRLASCRISNAET